MSSVESQFLESTDEVMEYKGKWIAILDKKIIAYGDTITEVYEQALKQHPQRTPLFHRVPTEDDPENFIL